MSPDRERKWQQYAEEHLVGRKIVGVQYMTAENAKSSGWSSRPLILILDNGTAIYPMADDEGNDGGTLAGETAAGAELGFPVL